MSETGRIPSPEEAPFDLASRLTDGVVAIDADGNIVAANEAAAMLAGRSLGALSDASFAPFFPERIREAVFSAFVRLLRDGTNPLLGRVLTLPIVRADGSELAVEMLVGPPDEDGTIVASLRATRWRGIAVPDLTQLLTSDQPLDEVLTELLERLGTSLEWEVALLWLPTDADGEETTRLAAAAVWELEPGRHAELVRVSHQISLGGLDSLVEEAWRTRAPLWSFDIASDPKFHRTAAAVSSDLRSGLIFPLMAGDRPVAVLEFFATGERDGDLWLASEVAAVADQLGVLLDRRLVHAQVQEERARLEMALQAGQLGVWTWDRGTGEVTWNETLERMFGLEPGGFAGTFDHYQQLLHPEDREAVLATIQASLEAKENHEVLHRVIRPDGQTRWIEAHGRVVTSSQGEAVGLTGLAIDVTERERYQRQLRREAHLVDLLLQVSRQVSSRMEMEEVGRAVAQIGCNLLHARVGVFRAHVAVDGNNNGDGADEESVLEVGIGLPDQPDVVLPPGIEQMMHEAMTSGGGPFRIGDLGDDGRWPNGSPDELPPMRSALVTSITDPGGDLLGGVAFARPDVDGFDSVDARVAASIAAQAGISLTNASRYQHEHRLAEQLQNSLTPDAPPDLPGAETWARLSAGMANVEIGGDFYDVLSIDGRAVMVVGDVRGHGIEAAKVMAELRYSLKAMLRAGLEPPAAIGELNRLLISELHTTATLIVVDVHLTSGHCTVWSAGHLPPVISRWGGEAAPVSLAGAGGPMLGVFDDLTLIPVTCHLDPGDTIVLYSDGLVERPNEVLDAGIARLAAEMSGATGDIGPMCDRVRERLRADLAPEHSDDQVMLVLRRDMTAEAG